MKISVSEYSKLCKVTRTVIYNRIKVGLLSIIKDRGTFFIDTEAYPPQGKRRAGRPLRSRLK